MENERRPYELLGRIQLYEATKDPRYAAEVTGYLERRTSPGSRAFEEPVGEAGLALFFALDETGDERYREAIERMAESAEGLLGNMPFFMEYDTRYRKKEHYQEIAAAFRKRLPCTGAELAVLIETIGRMSEEIYEYYRQLVDIFRGKIRDIADSGMAPACQAEEIGYSILKGCNIGVLQKEKYQDFGIRMIPPCLIPADGSSRESGPDRGESFGMADMLRAQYLILKKQEG